MSKILLAIVAIIGYTAASCQTPEQEIDWTLPFVSGMPRYEAGHIFMMAGRFLYIDEVTDRYLVGILNGGDGRFWMTEDQMAESMSWPQNQQVK